MSARPQVLAFAAGFLLASLLAAVLVLAQRGDFRRSISWQLPSVPTADPVLVVVVGDAARVDLVRRAVARERVVHAAPDGFALRERRIIAASFDDVGPLLMQAGWRDDPLEIVTLRPPATSPDGDRARKIAELMNQPTLNALEAKLALSLL